MTRIHILQREEMSAEQGKVFDDVKAEGGPLGGPYWAYISNPKLMRLQQDLSNCIAGGGLSKRERQMAIMAIIRHWGAAYPWSVQYKTALNLGIAADVLDTINAGGRPAVSDAREQMAFDVARELLGSRSLSPAAYDGASRLFSETELVSLIASIGQFSMTCLTTLAYDCTPAPGGAAMQKLDV